MPCSPHSSRRPLLSAGVAFYPFCPWSGSALGPEKRGSQCTFATLCSLNPPDACVSCKESHRGRPFWTVCVRRSRSIFPRTGVGPSTAGRQLVTPLHASGRYPAPGSLGVMSRRSRSIQEGWMGGHLHRRSTSRYPYSSDASPTDRK